MSVILGLAIVSAMAPVVAANAPITGLPDFTELVDRNAPAVVNISTQASDEGRAQRRFSIPEGSEDTPLHDFFRRFFDEAPMGPEGREPLSSLGSGFIISKDGYIISNYHVVRGAEEIIVRTSDRREYAAEIIGTDPRSDIALLKVDADTDLPVLKLGSSSALDVGEWVLAIGSPFGFEYSVTAGIVSAKGRSLPNENYVPFIQTDVAINPGNSGGPLFNLDGEVVGVNAQIYSRTGGFMGLSFAIPIDVVMNVYQQLRDKGSVTRGWLGVLIQDVTSDLAESFKMDRPHGALVSRVLPDSPAGESGIETGDIIVTFNGQHVSTSSSLPPMVGTAPVGAPSNVEVIRAGKRKSLQVTIGELPGDDEVQLAGSGSAGDIVNSRLNIVVEDLDDETREALDVADTGVIVKVVRDGPAADIGIQEGDVILQINSQPVENAAKLNEIVTAIPNGSSVPMLIQRQGDPAFLALKLPE